MAMNMGIITVADQMSAKTHQAETITGAQLLQLQSWFSPAFPTGAFTYSHGIESAIADEHVVDAASLQDWLQAIISLGSGWNDAVFMNAALRATTRQDWPELEDIDDLALALPAGAERDHESRSMGASFAKAASGWLADAVPDLSRLLNSQPEAHPFCRLRALPVISGAAASLTRLPAEAFITAAMQSSSSNLVWVAARLVPLGQSDALSVIANLAPMIQKVATQASISTLDDLGSCALMADIASLRHEHLQTRICRT